MLKGECGGNFIKNHNIKDCTNCLIPHGKGSYERIMSKMKDVVKKGSDF
jgi:Zn-finger protein